MSRQMLSAGDDILYMKVGVHANESLEQILERKRKEIDDVGFAMWGYGGSSCHPSRVREFADLADGRITLVMQKIDSHHFADQVRASQYSPDGVEWLDVPNGINVLGSKYALCLDSIDDVDFNLGLAGTRVAVGLREGRSGLDYIRGRVDKACLEVVDATVKDDEKGAVHISLAAPLRSPFAVLLRD